MRQQRTANDVIDLVIDRLASGIYPLGSKLPTSRELAEELGVHRNTIAKAYREIAGLNLLSMRQGRGTYVVAVPESNYERSVELQIDDALGAITLKARRFGITEADLRQRLDKQVSRIYKGSSLRLAFVECNDHDLTSAIIEIETLTNLRLDPMPLDDLSGDPGDVADQFDVILTSLFHITEVTSALRGHIEHTNIIGVYTQPDELAVTEIARLTPGSRVGIVVSNVGGGRRFVAQVHSYVAVDTTVIVAPSDSMIVEMSQLVDAIVCSRSRAKQVRSLHLSVPVIELSFHISRQSANRILEALDTWHRSHDRLDVHLEGQQSDQTVTASL